MSSSPLQASSYSREIVQRLRRSIWEQRFVLSSLVLGQFVSLCLCGMGVTSELLADNYDISVPTTQAFLNYLLLALTFGVYFATKKRFLTVLKYNWWKYIILGAMDVEANFLIILAYRYTDLTSIQLLDCFTIVVVMVLSYVFLKTRYKLINIIGVSLTVIGIACLVLADVNSPRNNGGSARFLGDMLCLLGAGIYGALNVTQEYLVKSHSIVEYLALIGVVGSFVSGAQLIGLERMDIARIQWSPAIGGLFSGFGISMFLFYSLVPWVIRMSSAIVFNLSLLTADFYTLLFGIFLFRYSFSGFYLLGFALVIFGIFIYNLRPPVEKKLRPRTQEQRRDRSIERQFSVATTKVESSEEPGKVNWRLRGLLETSTESTASLGILSHSYKKQTPRHYGTTETKRQLDSLAPLKLRTRYHGSAPVDHPGNHNHHGNCYQDNRDGMRVEIEAGSNSVHFSQSAPSCGYGEEGERKEEGERETLRRERYSVGREGGRGEGGEGGEEAGDAQRVSKRRRRSLASRRREDSITLLRDRADSESPPPPAPGTERRRKRRSSARQDEASPSAGKEDRVELERQRKSRSRSESIKEEVDVVGEAGGPLFEDAVKSKPGVSGTVGEEGAEQLRESQAEDRGRGGEGRGEEGEGDGDRRGGEGRGGEEGRGKP